MPVTMPYPPNLAPADWQKEMGAIAKLAAGKEGTGVSEKLLALKAAYDQVDFDRISFAKARKGVPDDQVDSSFVDKFEKTSRLEASTKGTRVNHAAEEVVKTANALSKSWGKNPLIPKKSVQAADNIANSARRFANELAKGLKEVSNKEIADALHFIGAANAEAKTALNKANKLADKIYQMQTLAVKVSQPAQWELIQTKLIRPIMASAQEIVKDYPELTAPLAVLKSISVEPDPATSDEVKKRGSKVSAHCIRLLKAIKH